MFPLTLFWIVKELEINIYMQYHNLVVLNLHLFMLVLDTRDLCENLSVCSAIYLHGNRVLGFSYTHLK